MQATTIRSLTSWVIKAAAAPSPDTSALQDAIAKAITEELPGIDPGLAADLAGSSAADLVTGLKDDQKAVLRRLTQRALLEDWPEAVLADRLARYVGIGERGTVAVESFRQQQIKQGVRPGVARKRANDYAKRLRTARAQTIARTELARITAEAKRLTWQDWKANGLIDPYVVRVWHTHKDERRCPTCRPLNGQRAAIGGTYKGGVVGPPLHPNCRCWETLQRGQDVVAKGGIDINNRSSASLSQFDELEHPRDEEGRFRKKFKIKLKMQKWINSLNDIKGRIPRMDDDDYWDDRFDKYDYEDHYSPLSDSPYDWMDAAKPYRWDKVSPPRKKNVVDATVAKAELMRLKSQVDTNFEQHKQMVIASIEDARARITKGMDYLRRVASADERDFGSMSEEQILKAVQEDLRIQYRTTPLYHDNPDFEGLSIALTMNDARSFMDTYEDRVIDQNFDRMIDRIRNAPSADNFKSGMTDVRAVLKWNGAHALGALMYRDGTNKTSLWEQLVGRTHESFDMSLRHMGAPPTTYADWVSFSSTYQSVYNSKDMNVPGAVYGGGLLSNATGVSGNPYYDAAAAMQSEWASTSANGSIRAWATQIAVAKLMERELPETHDVKWQVAGSYMSGSELADVIENATEMHNDHAYAMNVMAKAEYELTQESLHAAGIEELTIFRGMSVDDPPDKPELVRGKFNPASSWTYWAPTTDDFANGAGGYFMAVVPREFIVGLSQNGFGCFNEQEVIASITDTELWWLPNPIGTKDMGSASPFGKARTIADSYVTSVLGWLRRDYHDGVTQTKSKALFGILADVDYDDTWNAQHSEVTPFRWNVPVADARDIGQMVAIEDSINQAGADSAAMITALSTSVDAVNETLVKNIWASNRVDRFKEAAEAAGIDVPDIDSTLSVPMYWALVHMHKNGRGNVIEDIGTDRKWLTSLQSMSESDPTRNFAILSAIAQMGDDDSPEFLRAVEQLAYLRTGDILGWDVGSNDGSRMFRVLSNESFDVDELDGSMQRYVPDWEVSRDIHDLYADFLRGENTDEKRIWSGQLAYYLTRLAKYHTYESEEDNFVAGTPYVPNFDVEDAKRRTRKTMIERRQELFARIRDVAKDYRLTPKERYYRIQMMLSEEAEGVATDIKRNMGVVEMVLDNLMDEIEAAKED